MKSCYLKSLHGRFILSNKQECSVTKKLVDKYTPNNRQTINTVGLSADSSEDGKHTTFVAFQSDIFPSTLFNLEP